jgi:outer membrane protein OmpA-like peptidoglycan-associated protein
VSVTGFRVGARARLVVMRALGLAGVLMLLNACVVTNDDEYRQCLMTWTATGVAASAPAGGAAAIGGGAAGSAAALTLCENAAYELPAEPVYEAPVERDSDRDGVKDQWDQCPDTELGVAVNAVGCPFVMVFDDRLLNFDFDSARLPDNASDVLNPAVKFISAQSDMRFVISGHTDSKGSDAYNIDLSQRRARSVVDFLTSSGIDPTRLEIEAYGESRPVASNETDRGRAQNRRVEIRHVQ